MSWRQLIVFVGAATLPSALVAWLATFLVRRWAPGWGLIDKPGARKVHDTPTPLGGGLGIFLGLLAPLVAGQLAIWAIAADPQGALADLVPDFARPHLAGVQSQMPKLWVLVGAATILVALGLRDDRGGLPWQFRLFVQFAVAGACVWLIDDLRLTAFVDAPWLTIPLSALWIVALINSFNMLDNMDGLSGGVGAIVSGTLAAIMLTPPEAESGREQLFVAGFLLLLVGSTLGFLWHNRPPARIFMGDAGAYLIGFWIALATLLASYASYKNEARHAVITPLCAMAVPLYDMVTVILIRLWAGKSPFHADKNHFSHRLVDLGLTKPQAVGTVWLTTAVCGLAAGLLQHVRVPGAVLVVLIVLCVLCLIGIIETAARRTIQGRK